MDVWLYCNSSDSYDATQPHDAHPILYRHAQDPDAQGAYAHQFDVGSLSLIEADANIPLAHQERLNAFSERYFNTNLSELDIDITYKEIYDAACQKASSSDVPGDFLSALGVDGAIFKDGRHEHLMVRSLADCTYLGTHARQLPPNIWFHGSREDAPIEHFEHGHHPAHAGLAGFGVVEVSRHAFFFSSDPRMSEGFGHVHAYQLKTDAILDLRNDLSEMDAEKIRSAGFSPEGIDRMYEKWELFDGDNGKEFCNAMCDLGYDAVRYLEADHDGVLRECMAALTPSIIRPANVDAELVQSRVQALTLFDAWRTMYSKNRNQLSSEQLTRELKAIGTGYIQETPVFYARIEEFFRDYNYAAVNNVIQSCLSKGPDMQTSLSPHNLRQDGVVLSTPARETPKFHR